MIAASDSHVTPDQSEAGSPPSMQKPLEAAPSAEETKVQVGDQEILESKDILLPMFSNLVANHHLVKFIYLLLIAQYLHNQMYVHTRIHTHTHTHTH